MVVCGGGEHGANGTAMKPRVPKPTTTQPLRGRGA